MTSTAPARSRPDWSGDERSQLAQVLDYNRASVRLKAEGLTDEQARQRLTPSPLTSIAGVVSHLIWVERYWIEDVLGRRDVTYPWNDEHPDGDWEQGDTRSITDLLDDYDAVCESGRDIVAGLELDLNSGARVEAADLGASDTPPHDRGDSPPRRPHRHPARADRRRHRRVAPLHRSASAPASARSMRRCLGDDPPPSELLMLWRSASRQPEALAIFLGDEIEVLRMALDVTPHERTVRQHGQAVLACGVE